MLSELSQSGRLVAHMNGTKFGNLGLGNTTVGENLVHTRITIQHAVSILSLRAKKFVPRNLRGIVLAERIADKNK